MKVDPTNTLGTDSIALTSSRAAEANRVDSPKRAAVESTATPERAPDQVKLSNLLEKLRSLEVSDEDEISTERAAYLDRLSAQVANGEYEVDSSQLSSRIVDDTLKGLG